MPTEFMEEWLRVADHDLRAVRNNLYGPEPSTFAAAYHVQQAAEKVVKAVLAALSHDVPRTHDIAALMARVPEDLPLRHHLESLERFSIYAVLYRYPQETVVDDPTPEEVEERPGRGRLRAGCSRVLAVRSAPVSYLQRRSEL